MADASCFKTILAADIGGTHSRFGLFRLDTRADALSEGLRFLRGTRFPTSSVTDTAHMMRLLAESHGEDGGFFTPASPEPVHVDAAVFGVPGPAAPADISIEPPDGEVCYCPNVEWPLESGPVVGALGGVSVRFINDFVANGFACAMLPHILDARTVLPGESKPRFPRAVIGAGTGLGHCLILSGNVPVVAGAEAGHALFPFTLEEEDIHRYLASIHGTDRLNGDMVVAGGGLSNLYAYCTGEKASPHEVPPLAARNERVMELFARFYGRAVQHYALNTLPLGGIFITGGLAAGLPGVLAHPSFSAELREKNAMGRSLGPIPVLHVRNTDTGLWGAAACASLLLR